jgi:hypothetical protein
MPKYLSTNQMKFTDGSSRLVTTLEGGRKSKRKKQVQKCKGLMRKSKK